MKLRLFVCLFINVLSFHSCTSFDSEKCSTSLFKSKQDSLTFLYLKNYVSVKDSSFTKKHLHKHDSIFQFGQMTAWGLHDFISLVYKDNGYKSISFVPNTDELIHPFHGDTLRQNISENDWQAIVKFSKNEKLDCRPYYQDERELTYDEDMTYLSIKMGREESWFAWSNLESIEDSVIYPITQLGHAIQKASRFPTDSIWYRREIYSDTIDYLFSPFDYQLLEWVEFKYQDSLVVRDSSDMTFRAIFVGQNENELSNDFNFRLKRYGIEEEEIALFSLNESE